MIMGPKACESGRYPWKSDEFEIGKEIYCYFEFKNCGDARGPFYGYLYVDGSRKDSTGYTDLDPGQRCSKLRYNFTMPNRTVKVRFEAKAWRDGAYRTDVNLTYTLTPKAILCNCTYWVDRECVRHHYRRQTRTCTPSGCDVEEREVWDALCVVCTCTSWTNRECVSDTHRRQTRTCTPSGCESEERTVSDPRCAPLPAAFHFEYLSKTEKARSGQHVEAKIRIWNDSDFAIEVQSYIMDGTTVIEKEPDIIWKDIAVGESTDITLSTYGPSPDMPDHDWHLDVKVCAREKGWF